MEVTFSGLVKNILKRIYIVILIAIIFLLAEYIVTEFCIEPQYMSSMSFTVDADGKNESEIAKQYVTYGKYDIVLDAMARDESIVSMGYTKEDLKRILVMSADGNILKVSAITNDQSNAKAVLTVYRDVAISVADEEFIEEAHTLKEVSSPAVGVKIAPDMLMNLGIAFVIGGIIGVLIIVFMTIAFPKLENIGDVKTILEDKIIVSLPCAVKKEENSND